MNLFSALVLFLGRLGAVIKLTSRDDGLRRSVFPGPNSTYARVLLYHSTNTKILIPTKLGVENARLAFLLQQRTAQGKCCRLRSQTRPAGNVIVSRPSKYSLVRQTYIFRFSQSLNKPPLLRPCPYITNVLIGVFTFILKIHRPIDF